MLEVKEMYECDWTDIERSGRFDWEFGHIQGENEFVSDYCVSDNSVMSRDMRVVVRV